MLGGVIADQAGFRYFAQLYSQHMHAWHSHYMLLQFMQCLLYYSASCYVIVLHQPNCCTAPVKFLKVDSHKCIVAVKFSLRLDV